MTVRAVVLGLFVSIVLACLGYINDAWFFFSYIGGDLMPTYAFGLLLLALLVANPLMGRWKFKAGELVTMLALAMMGSTLAGSAFYWQYPHPMITPIHVQAEKVGWLEQDVLQYAPPPLMVDARPGSPVVTDYMQGVDHDDYLVNTNRLKIKFLKFSKVPWDAWRGTMAFWTAVLSLGFIAGICAIVIVHRQWSKREHLAYPIAAFTQELLRADDRPVNPIFRNRLFWGGFAISFIILMINGYQEWNPESIKVTTSIDCTKQLTEISFFKTLVRVPHAGQLLNVRFFFVAIGLAYFLSSEASFSMGISGWLFALVALPFVLRGVDLSGGMLEGNLPSHMWFGAYFGMGVVVVYLGRRFYKAVLRRAAFIPTRAAEDVLPREAWAARILIFVWVAMVLLLWWVGLHPLLGVAFALLSCLLFVMMARLHVATGLFVIQPLWHPVSILLALFGGFALGPQAIAILALLCTATTIDARIAAAPLVANALWLADRSKTKVGPVAAWMGVAIVASLAVSLVFTVWLIYDTGVSAMDSTGTKWGQDVAKMPFEMVKRETDELEGVGKLKEAQKPTDLGRLFGEARPGKYVLHAMGIGVALVLVCSYLRLRFSGWPLHPLMFLVWGQPWMTAYAPSFLLAWLLKSMIMKYGGQKAYRTAKPIFIGLVVGEFLAAMLWGIVGVVMYKTTGQLEHFLTRQ